MAYFYLTIAIIAEVAATTALKASQSFSVPLPSVVVVIGYAIAFYCMTLVLKTLPVGITYAIWSGTGIVLVTVLGALIYRQIPDTGAIVGIGLIIAGVAVIHLFSDSVGH